MKLHRIFLPIIAIGIVVALLIPETVLAGTAPTFGTPPNAPNVSAFTDTTATIAWGGVNTNANPTTITCYWCNVDGGDVAANWGTTDGGGNSTIPLDPEGYTPPSFIITGLTASTKYYWNMVVTNPNGSTWWTTGTSNSFTTTAVVNTTAVTTVSATNPTTTSVNLNGNITNLGGGSLVYVCFFYGVSSSYLTSSPSQTSLQVQDVLQPFTASVTSGLLPNTTYYFCAGISPDGQNWHYGNTLTFFTGISSTTTNVKINNVGLFSNYETTGDLLICMEVYCNLTGLAPTASPSQNFVIELLDPTDTTIIASTPLLQWRDRPESIYLSPTLASTLTPDGAYHIQVDGLFSGAVNPYVDYIVQPADWSKLLPTWIIGVGNDMELYDFGSNNGTYVTSSTSSGSIITDAGGGFFTTSIPNIQVIESASFQQSTSQATVPSNLGSPANDQYDTNHNWTTQFGTQITSDWNTLGGVIGVSGRSAMGYAVALVILILTVIGVTMGGKGLPCLILTYPLILWGTEMGTIGIQWLVVPCIAMVLLFARQFWVKPT